MSVHFAVRVQDVRSVEVTNQCSAVFSSQPLYWLSSLGAWTELRPKEAQGTVLDFIEWKN